MTVQEIIYAVLSGSADVNEIFHGNIFPLSTKKQMLPAILYQVEQTEVNHSKTGPSILDVHSLKLHLFSEDYLELARANKIIKSLLDFKEMTDGLGETVVELARFEGNTEDYSTTDDMFTQTLNFSLFISPEA